MPRKPTMPKPAPKPAAADRAQHERYVAMAREIGADESLARFDRVFARVARPPATPKAKRDNS